MSGAPYHKLWDGQAGGDVTSSVRGIMPDAYMSLVVSSGVEAEQHKLKLNGRMDTGHSDVVEGL